MSPTRLIRRRLGPLGDERGTTLVELLVATAAGVVVMMGLTTAVTVTLRQSNRVASHVDANQRARLTMTRVVDQLHSACYAYDFAPVMEKSTGTTLIFSHPTTATAAKVSPTPVKTEILLSGTTLTQRDYAATNTGAPWTYSSAAATTTLMTGISPITAGAPIFRYYPYASGKVSTTPLTVPLSAADAERTVQVSVAFKANPLKNAIANDQDVATAVQDSALLRFTPSGFETAGENLPCE